MRLGIISDIHEDYCNLQKVLKKLERKGYDHLACLGDISGFSSSHYRYHRSRNASACLNLIRDRCDTIIAGNHDLHGARRIPEHSGIFDFPPDWYDLELQRKIELTNREIWLHEEDLDPRYSREELQFLEGLPEYHILQNGEQRILLSHYAYPNLSGFRKQFYIWGSEFQSHFRFMESHHCAIGFIGHAHPRGCFMVTPQRFRHYPYRKLKTPEEAAIIGVPPVTRHKKRSGFCIFDTHSRTIQAVK